MFLPHVYFSFYYNHHRDRFNELFLSDALAFEDREAFRRELLSRGDPRLNGHPYDNTQGLDAQRRGDFPSRGRCPRTGRGEKWNPIFQHLHLPEHIIQRPDVADQALYLRIVCGPVRARNCLLHLACRALVFFWVAHRQVAASGLVRQTVG